MVEVNSGHNWSLDDYVLHFSGECTLFQVNFSDAFNFSGRILGMISPYVTLLLATLRRCMFK